MKWWCNLVKIRRYIMAAVVLALIFTGATALFGGGQLASADEEDDSTKSNLTVEKATEGAKKMIECLADGKTSREECVKKLSDYPESLTNCIADEVEKNPGSANNEQAKNQVMATCVKKVTGTDKDLEKCYDSADALGWIACPSMSDLEEMVNSVLDTIRSKLDWTMLTGNTAADNIRTNWEKIRAIANIAFVIMFAVMLYSLATSSGLSSYKVKQILPRLIITAAAVNFSFYICAAMVDLSNISGKAIFLLIAGSAGDISNIQISGLASIFAIGVAIVVGLIFLGSAAVAVMSLFLAFQVRQVALIILVVVSPLAFAARMLPNTEKLWTKWKELFQALLVIYPMFMAMWAASMWCRALINGGTLVDLALLIAPLFGVLPLLQRYGGMMGAVSGAAQQWGRRAKIDKAGNWVGRAPMKASARAAGRPTARAATRLANSKLGRSRPGMARRLHSYASWAGDSSVKIDEQAAENAKYVVGNMSDADVKNILMGDKKSDRYTFQAAMDRMGDKLNINESIKAAETARKVAPKLGANRRDFLSGATGKLRSKSKSLDSVLDDVALGKLGKEDSIRGAVNSNFVNRINDDNFGANDQAQMNDQEMAYVGQMLNLDGKDGGDIPEGVSSQDYQTARDKYGQNATQITDNFEGYYGKLTGWDAQKLQRQSAFAQNWRTSQPPQSN